MLDFILSVKENEAKENKYKRPRQIGFIWVDININVKLMQKLSITFIEIFAHCLIARVFITVSDELSDEDFSYKKNDSYFESVNASGNFMIS